MPKAEKVEKVAELSGRIEGSVALLLTDYRGLTVSDIKEVRRSLAEGGASFAVVKNTLMERAVAGEEMGGLVDLLDGPTAVAFVSQDPVAAAKSVVDAGKKFPALTLKGAFLDGRVLSATDARALADLESRDVMLSKIAGMIKGEVSRAAALLQAAQARFLGLLEAYKEKVPSGDEPASQQDAQAPAEPGSDEPATAEGKTSAAADEQATTTPDGEDQATATDSEEQAVETSAEAASSDEGKE